jgi:hypothetical protein
MIYKIAKQACRPASKNCYFYGITPQFMHPLDSGLLLDESPKTTKRTKTVCTIGYNLILFSPNTEHPEKAGKLIDEGLSVARLNFSHGDHV